MSLPNTQEWRSKGHTFTSIPDSIQETILRSSTFTLSASDLDAMLPNPRLSILDFAQAPLPPKNDPRYQNLSPSFEFFSKQPPTAQPDSWPSIPLPSKGLTAQLSTSRSQAYLDGMESIKVPTSDLFLPLSVIRYWTRVHALYGEQDEWENGIQFLQHRRLAAFSDIVTPLFHTLATLTWSGDIFAKGDFDLIKFPKSPLSRFLSRQWLCDSDIDMLTALLEKKLFAKDPEHSVVLVDSIHASYIVREYNLAGSSGGAYKPPAHLQRFGDSITAESVIAGVFHTPGHWISMVIDLPNAKIHYGDGAKPGTQDHDLVAALFWFCKQHVSRLPSLDEFHLEELPSPTQNVSTDSWNCGVFAFNSIQHHLISTPLLTNTENPGFGDAARLSLLQDIIEYSKANYIPSDALMLNMIPLAVQRCDLSQWLDVKIPPKKSKSVKKSVTDFFTVTSRKRKAANPPVATGKKRSKAKSTELTQPSTVVFNDAYVVPPIPPPKDDSSSSDSEASDSGEETDRTATPTITSTDTKRGRPLLTVLDKLSILWNNQPGDNPRRYKCIGKGCNVTWKPRAKDRVLKHAKNCRALTQQQRQTAASHSALSAPSVAAAANPLPATPSPPTKASASSTFYPGPFFGCDDDTETPPPRTSDTFFGPGGQKAKTAALDFAILKLMCCKRIPPNVFDSDEWKDVLKIGNPSYKPAGKDKIVDTHLMSEQSKVIELQYQLLGEERNISITFDGGSIKSGEALFTVHATTQAGRVMLMEGRDCTDVSHTGKWIADLVMEVIDRIGPDRVTSVASDSTGNTKLARRLIAEKLLHILDLPDPQHHLNNLWKEIAGLEYFDDVINIVRAVIKYFRHSNIAKARLRALRLLYNLGAGLESIGKTRFATLVWAAVSILRCLRAIRELCTNGEIDIPGFNQYFQKDDPDSLTFEIQLTQFIAVGLPIARTIQCLEATSANPADVYLYNIAYVARLKEVLVTCRLPSHVCEQIRKIINRRWKGFFVTGSSNAHLAAFYLHPAYVRSDIFHNANALSFSINLPARSQDESVSNKVPPGIRSPKTFIEVGKYLHRILLIEVQHGNDPYLSKWKRQLGALVEAFQTQFTAYAQGMYPFAIPLGNQTPLNWWKGYEGTNEGGVLAAIAIKLFSAVPHSMADERTMSYITMLNSALRNRQRVPTVIATSQVAGFYSKPRKQRRSARPNPTLRFYDIEKLRRRGLDDDERDADPNYDESDDETELRVPRPADSNDSKEDGLTLPEESNGDINLASVEVREILADGPIAPEAGGEKATVVVSGRVKGGEGATRDDEDFELKPWA